MSSRDQAWPLLTTISRAERAALRAARTMARRYAQAGGAREDVARDLGATEADLRALVVLHQASVEPSSILALAAASLVEEPVRTRTREQAARRELVNYTPTWSDRAFGREIERRRELTARVATAAREDATEYAKRKALSDKRNGLIRLAQGLASFDPTALRNAVADHSALSSLGRHINGLSLVRPRHGSAVIRVHVLHEDDLPEYRIRRKPELELIPLTVGERRELHLRYVCSAALRVAVEMTALVPGEFAVVAESDADMDNSLERLDLLELPISGEALSEFDLTTGDAVELARGLSVRVKWSPQQGFTPLDGGAEDAHRGAA